MTEVKPLKEPKHDFVGLWFLQKALPDGKLSKGLVFTGFRDDKPRFTRVLATALGFQTLKDACIYIKKHQMMDNVRPVFIETP